MTLLEKLAVWYIQRRARKRFMQNPERVAELTKVLNRANDELKVINAKYAGASNSPSGPL